MYKCNYTINHGGLNLLPGTDLAKLLHLQIGIIRDKFQIAC